MSTSTRDPITCHVLDTTTGRPGPNIDVKLFCTTIPDIVFSSKTNDDGRIANWGNTQGPNGTVGSFVETKGGVSQTIKFIMEEYAAKEGTPRCPLGSSIWKLQFDTGSYYGVTNTFFPMVELTFLVKEGEHFHVPLLLGPYSFTTYRGS